MKKFGRIGIGLLTAAVILCVYGDVRVSKNKHPAAGDSQPGQVSSSGEYGTDGESTDAAETGSEPAAGGDAQADYVVSIPDISPEKPKKRSYEEVLKRLEALGEQDPRIKQICKEPFLYPKDLLAALANNPEMADFVVGYTEHAKDGDVGFTEKELEEEYPLFLQWDPRWGYRAYGKTNIIGVAGCGPTCLSMALFYLLRDPSLTPDRIAAYSARNGYYEEGVGTAWLLMEELPVRYGLSVSKPVKTESAIRAVLDRGGIVICAMGSGDFTSGGHFIVIYRYDYNGFYVNDPNCVARSKKVWTFRELEWQIRGIWGIR